jgi:3-isopropylmalate dehydrogenase
MLRWSLGLDDAADAVEGAVAGAIAAGVRTPDIIESGKKSVSTGEFGDEVSRRVETAWTR